MTAYRKLEGCCGDRLLKRGVTLTLAGLATCVAGTVKPASAAVATTAATEIASTATLYAAGGTTASEVGVSVSVLQTANNVIVAMTKAKIVAVSLAALAIVMFLGSMGGLVGSIQSARAGTILFEDNFDDGSFTDSWELSPINSGSLAAGTGEFVLGKTAETDPQFDVYADAPSVRLQDSSVRAKVRVTANGGSALLASRLVDRSDTQGYGAGVAYLPNFGGSILYAMKSLGGTQIQTFPPTGVDVVRLDYDVRTEFTNVQLDVFGDEIKVWGWRDGEEMPTEPQIEATDTTFGGPGYLRVLLSNRGLPQGALGNSEAIFDDIMVGDMPIHTIPEPTTSSLGLAAALLCIASWRVRRDV